MLSCVLLTTSVFPLAAHAQVQEVRKEAAVNHGVPRYVADAAMFKSVETHPDAADGMVGAWMVGALFSPVGGHLWAPRLFYKDIPANKPSQSSLILGGIATVLPWILVFNMVAHGVTATWWWVPWVGWLGGSGVQVVLLVVDVAVVAALIFLELWLFPRAIHSALSDAYALDADESPAEERARTQDDDDNDEDE